MLEKSIHPGMSVWFVKLQFLKICATNRLQFLFIRSDFFFLWTTQKIQNAVVPPVTRERMIAKSSPSSTPLDRVEATRSRSSQKNRAPAGSRQMMVLLPSTWSSFYFQGPCPLVPVKHVPYHGPKRFEVTDPRVCFVWESWILYILARAGQNRRTSFEWARRLCERRFVKLRVRERM